MSWMRRFFFRTFSPFPDAMGLGLYFEEGEGPKFRKPVRTEADIEQLKVCGYCL